MSGPVRTSSNRRLRVHPNRSCGQPRPLISGTGRLRSRYFHSKAHSVFLTEESTRDGIYGMSRFFRLSFGSNNERLSRGFNSVNIVVCLLQCMPSLVSQTSK
jgi:hypothetical protein